MSLDKFYTAAAYLTSGKDGIDPELVSTALQAGDADQALASFRDHLASKYPDHTLGRIKLSLIPEPLEHAIALKVGRVLSHQNARLIGHNFADVTFRNTKGA